MKLKTLFQITLALGVLSTQLIALADGKTVASAKQEKTQRASIKEVIAEQEAQKGIPQDLLKAIAKIESGLSPWAVNAGGRSHIFRSKEAAAKYVRELVEEGTTNFSVGCMQLHYASHRRHFKTVEAMFEPENNIAHAAKLIKTLERRHGSMERAIKLYHSPSPSHHNPYKNRVYGMWAKIRRHSQPKDAFLKTASLETTKTQKQIINKNKPASKIKFGVGAAAAKKRKF
jgi:soluble lytic murein transglycosylase-like protein